MSTLTSAFHHAHDTAVRAPGFVGRLLSLIAEEIRIHHSMRQLASLDDAMLRDIGIDRGAVEDAVRHGRDALDGTTARPSRVSAAGLPASLTEWR